MSEESKSKVKDYTELVLKVLLTIIGTLGLLILNNVFTEVKSLNVYIQSVDSRVKIIEYIHKEDLKYYLSK